MARSLNFQENVSEAKSIFELLKEELQERHTERERVEFSSNFHIYI